MKLPFAGEEARKIWAEMPEAERQACREYAQKFYEELKEAADDMALAIIAADEAQSTIRAVYWSARLNFQFGTEAEK